MHCVVMCTWAQVPIKARSVRRPGAIVTGSCKLPNTGAGNQTLVLSKKEQYSPLTNKPSVQPQGEFF